MFQNYFIVNGGKYYTGTIFITNCNGKHVEAEFVCYDVKHKRFVYKINKCIWRSDDKNFWRKFISLTDKKCLNTHMPTTKTKKDLEIDGLFLGWVWYIFLMSVSIIFKDAIGLWTLISIVFFGWRAKKIKEEGTYIEW